VAQKESNWQLATKALPLIHGKPGQAGRVTLISS